jgi:polyhydroxyalkanoate synthesis regulator phasin
MTMGFLDKAKEAAEQAAAMAKSGAEAAANKAKETADEVQTKRELGQTYDALGKLAHELVEAGELAHDKLTPLVDKIRELTAKLEAGDAAAPADTAEETAETPAGTAA